MELSYSRLNSFLQCPRLFKYRYIDKVESRSHSIPMEFGTVFHEAIEAMYARQNLGKIIHDAIEKFNIFLEDDMHPKKKEKFFKYLSCLTGGITNWYINFYLKDMEQDIEIISTESLFKDIPIKDPITGKSFYKMTWKMVPDQIVRINGELWIYEYKTKARLKPGFWDHLDLDQQIMTYIHYCEQVFGEKIKGIKYRIFKVPGIRQGKKEELEDFYSRMHEEVMKPETLIEEVIPYNEENQKEFVSDHFKQIKLFKYSAQNFFFPKNTDACLSNGICDYMKACLGTTTNEFNHYYKSKNQGGCKKVYEFSKK